MTGWEGCEEFRGMRVRGCTLTEETKAEGGDERKGWMMRWTYL